MFQFFNIGIGVCVRLKVSYYTGIGKFFPYPFYFRIKLEGNGNFRSSGKISASVPAENTSAVSLNAVLIRTCKSGVDNGL